MKRIFAVIILLVLALTLVACNMNVSDGKDGADGKTPYIQDGYWYIDGVNTGVRAEGTDGKDGIDGTDGKDGVDGADGKTPYIQDGYWYIDGVNTGIRAECGCLHDKDEEDESEYEDEE